jgi:plastocyanin
MNMNYAWLRIVATVFVGCVCLAPSARSQEAAQQATGAIKGRIRASGVRDVDNVLVYVEKAPGEYPPPKEPAEVDQAKLTFVPHVLPIVKGTTVRFLNSDPILHNVFWPASDDGSYAARNLGTWGKGASKEIKFDKLGSVVLLCNVHPEMEGHILVLENPFFAMADKDGNYEIKNVPAGQYSVRAWYPNPRKLKAKTAKAAVTAGQATQLDFSLSRR